MKIKYLSLILCLILSQTYAQNYKFGKVSKAEVAEKHHPLDESANAAILYREQKVFYEIGQSEGMIQVTEVSERIKIYNNEGFNWATKNIISHKNGTDVEEVVGIKGYTYNLVKGKLTEEKLRKSEIYEEEQSKYRTVTKFTMPAVNDGSVVEWKYTIRSPFTSSIDKVPLQFTIPVNKLDVEVSIPEFYNFKKYFNPKSPVIPNLMETTSTETYNYTEKTRSGGFNYTTVQTDYKNKSISYAKTNYIIQESNIPALKKELYVDYLQNYASYLMLELQFIKFPNSAMKMYAQTWEDVTKSIYNDRGLKQEIHHTGFFDKDVDKLLEGISNPSTKANLIYNFVKQRVKWNDYVGFIAENGIKEAYKEGTGNTGDINLLLVAMLKYAGINANPVLASTPDNGIPIFPTQNGFNYVLASIELPNKILLLDATDKNNAFGDLPAIARNWQGRVIRENGSSTWVDLIPKTKSEKQTNINIKFDEELNIQGKNITVYNGLYAKSYRDNYMGVNQEDYIKVLEKDKGNIIITDLQTKNAKDIGKSVKEIFNFELTDAVEMIDASIYINPLFYLAMQENPFKAEERSYPIFMDFPSIEKKVVNIMVPAGYEVSSLPQSTITKLNGEQAEFAYMVSQNGNYLRIEAILDLSRMVYASNEYENLKKFYSDVVENQTEMIVLTKTEAK